jgi:hypothetical protein
MPLTSKFAYDVIVVKRPPGFRPIGCRDAPAAADEMATLLRSVPRWAAAAFCRGFNQAESLQPYGVWAVMKPSRPAPANNGHYRNRH